MEATQMTKAELEELRDIVYPWHLVNYESDDPCDEIDPVSHVAPDGDTCLHSTAFRGELRAVQLLGKAGLDINRQGDMGKTPLHYADTFEGREGLFAAISCRSSTTLF